MDVNVSAPITRALRRHGIDVLTAQEDHRARAADPELLDRATSLGRILFTMDADFLVETTRRLHAGLPFATVVYVWTLDASIGRYVEDLLLIAATLTEEEQGGQVIYLPL